jgi:cell division protein FtsB
MRLNKYWLVGIIFFVITFLFGEANLYNRYRYDDKIRALEIEIQRYRKEIENSKKQLKELHTDKDGLERFAREEYLMKRDDEDIFLFDE